MTNTTKPGSNSMPEIVDDSQSDALSSGSDASPSIRQGLHALTGDRDAEAKALADRSGDDVDEPDARIAVGRAHGDLAGGESGVDNASDIATPAEASAVQETSPAAD